MGLVSILKSSIEQLAGHIKDSGMSRRQVAKAAGVSAALLSQIFSGKKRLTVLIAEKLAQALGLSHHLSNVLVESARMEQSENASDKAQALRAFARSKAFSKTHPEERKLFEYFYEWFLPVLREAARTDLGALTEKEISQRLMFELPPDQVKKGLSFLERNGLLKKDLSGKWRLDGNEAPSVDGDVYRLALARFHDHGARHAIESITRVPRERRLLEGMVVSLSADEWVEVQQTLSKTVKDILKRSKTDAQKTDVYHVGVYAFPYTIPKADS
jgi:uncharacterized protein (TIGR02147 family)